jgi:hypothetical protein
VKINITAQRLAAIAKSKAGQIPSFLKKEYGAVKSAYSKPSSLDKSNAAYGKQMKTMETNSAWQKEYKKNNGR